MFHVINRNTREKSEIYSSLTIKTSERRQQRRSGIFIVKLEYVSLAILLLTLNTYLLTEQDIRLGFNDCVILFWLSSYSQGPFC